MRLKRKVAVLYHLFYEDTIDHLLKEMEGLQVMEPYFFFNISSDMPNQQDVQERLSIYFPGCMICQSSNKGKDIGGKLLLLNNCIQLNINPEWFIFLHDKKSLQAFNARFWKSSLLRIIDKEQVDTVAAIIEKDGCGIVAAKNYVLEESKKGGKFVSVNGRILDHLLHEYGINCQSSQYVAGTMFWAKAAPILQFFTQHDPLKVRQTLEEGNVLDNFGGTVTHAWERMLSWIITSRGFYIKEV
jgi:lipopolysaccharide biosynthesis protein